MGGPKSNWGKKISFLAVFSLLLIQITPSFAQDYYHPKSENAAFALSLFGTALPVGSAILLDMDDTREESDFPFYLAAGGLVVGPSLGYFYADLDRRAWKGLALRSTVALATVFSVVLVGDEFLVFNTVKRVENQSTQMVFFVIGAGAVAISALTDIFSVSGHVKRRNQKLWYGDFAVLPAYLPQHQAPGLQLQIIF